MMEEKIVKFSSQSHCTLTSSSFYLNTIKCKVHPRVGIEYKNLCQTLVDNGHDFPLFEFSLFFSDG